MATMTTTNTNDVQHMIQLLHGLIQPNTETIRAAEQALKPILKQPASMDVLWTIITSNSISSNSMNIDESQYIAIRHVATIVLRKRLPAHYSNTFGTDRNTAAQWPTKILQTLATETVRPVRTGLLGVAAVLAAQQDPAMTSSLDSPYLQFMMAAAASPDPNAQTLLFQLMEEMTTTIGTHWKERVQDLYHLYYNVLRDVTPTGCTTNGAANSTTVQCAAVKALGQLLSFWVDDDTEMTVMAPLIPLFLQVAAHHVTQLTSSSNGGNANSNNNNNINQHPNSMDDDMLDDLLSTVLDVLYDISYSAANALQAHMVLMIEFSLLCLQCTHLSLRVRDAAALVIATNAEAKPKLFGKQTALLGKVIDTLFQMMQNSPVSAAGALFESNPAWRADLEDTIHPHGNADDDDDEADPDSPTETSMAQGTLDMIACEIPNKYVWPICISRCMTLMNNEQDAAARKAGAAGLGVIAEGCSEKCIEQLADIMPYIFRACTDTTSPQVRECACFCLGQLSEHCQPDILNYATQILPIIFTLLDDGSVAVQATSCYVLEMFCERLEPSAVRPVLDPLVRKLATMLENTTTKRSVQEMAVAAMAATAVAAEQDFTPYVAGIATLMEQRMAITSESHFSLRGRALECMGHIAIAVGRDHFRPYFPMTMQRAMEGLTMNSTDLQEFAYAVFANLSTVMKEEFAPALPELVPFLIQVIDQDEGQLERRSDNDNADGFTGLDDSDNDDDDDDAIDDDDEDNDGNYVLHIRTALLEVKKGAITALGEMAAHTGSSFCPYIESSLQVLQKSASNWHPLIKTEAADAMPSLIVPSIAAYHDGKCEWKKGDVTGTHAFQLSQHTSAIANAVLVEEIALLKDDETKTVAKACEAVQSIIELCGPMVVVPVIQELLTATHEFLIRAAPCQTGQLYDGGAVDDVDDEDHDTTTQAACDLIGAYMRVLGPQLFGQYLVQFLPPVVDYCKTSRPPADRAMAIGCLGEIAQECIGSEIGVSIMEQNWSTVFFPCILATIGDSENDNVQRNAAFCAGVSVEALKDRISIQDCQTLLQGLGPLLNRNTNAGPKDSTANDSAMACVDNAVAAIARMIMYGPAGGVPLGQVLPVMLAALPLETDFTENDTVYNCLLGLLNMVQTNADVQANVATIQRILTSACQEDGDTGVEENMQQKIKAALQSFNMR
jgi:hypothetical protein